LRKFSYEIAVSLHSGSNFSTENMTHGEEMTNAYIILAEILGEKKPLAKLMHEWNNNIKINLKEMRCEY
jgi:hypothetical protein